VDDSQFIDIERIREAQKRPVVALDSDPLVAGVDLAWGGDDFNVVRFRRGKDARSIPQGRPAQKISVTGGVLHGHLDWRPLANLSDAEMQVLDVVSKKLREPEEETSDSTKTIEAPLVP
jgi:hypothetical protein